MNAELFARPAIAEMNGTPALPRRSGELVFHDQWERRAFAIAVSLAEQGLLEWNDFQPQLVKAIASAEGNDPLHPSRGYYESWLAALESVLAEKRLLPDGWRIQSTAPASSD
jgi:nitrile hydratase accessory protein